MPKTNTILLTGAGGMLGSALADILARQHEISAFRKSKFDITDQSAVKKKIAETRPDFVVNCAAYTAVDDCETHADQANLTNGTAVGYLAEACQQNNATLIHFSTDYVFDGQNSKGYIETDKTNPINAYGRSKLLGERLIQQSGCQHAIIRTSWLFGPGGDNFVTKMLELGKKQSELKIVSDQIGSPTFTVDLAEAVARMIKSELPCPSNIFHLTNSGAASWADFATEIFRRSSLPAKVTPVSSSEFPRPASRPAYSILLNTKTPPLRSWQEALGEYLK